MVQPPRQARLHQLRVVEDDPPRRLLFASRLWARLISPDAVPRRYEPASEALRRLEVGGEPVMLSFRAAEGASEVPAARVARMEIEFDERDATFTTEVFARGQGERLRFSYRVRGVSRSYEAVEICRRIAHVAGLHRILHEPASPVHRIVMTSDEGVTASPFRAQGTRSPWAPVVLRAVDNAAPRSTLPNTAWGDWNASLPVHLRESLVDQDVGIDTWAPPEAIALRRWNAKVPLPIPMRAAASTAALAAPASVAAALFPYGSWAVYGVSLVGGMVMASQVWREDRYRRVEGRDQVIRFDFTQRTMTIFGQDGDFGGAIEFGQMHGVAAEEDTEHITLHLETEVGPVYLCRFSQNPASRAVAQSFAGGLAQRLQASLIHRDHRTGKGSNPASSPE
ncbi:MAG: hypothetical protein AAGA56_07820 [Myxococcota bacterium]